MELRFPNGFLWGSAGSAHQTEGGNSNSDWWVHELDQETNAAEPSGPACDSYNRFQQDWELLADSGQNAVRFSIEWARIEPSPGEFSNAQLDHYREVMGTAQDLGLKTCVTLHHFTNPLWFSKEGAWERKESTEVFGRYAAKCSEAFGDLLEMVTTINEPQIVASAGYALGFFPPRKTDMTLSHRVTTNLIKAHGAANEAIRASTSARMGLALSINEYIPTDETEEAKQFRDFVYHGMTGVYLEALASGNVQGLSTPDEFVPTVSADDFVGVQYYTRWVTDQRQLEEGAGSIRRGSNEERTTDMGWVWNPEGLGRVLEDVARLDMPIYITENGIATNDDEERKEYVEEHLRELHGAIGRGADVRGYFYWSYIDNFEWNEGYRPKFGLISVDHDTFERIPKPSLEWYGGIARNNALSD